MSSKSPLLLCLLLAGCATKRPPVVEPSPAEAAPELLPDWPGLADAERTPLLGGWKSDVRTEHPLVGIRWDLAEARPMGWDELVERAGRHRYLLLGEKHDNPDHHRLQARLVGTLAQPDAVVAFEMLDEDDAPQLPTPFATNTFGSTPSLALGPEEEADRVAEAVGWAESGWYDFALYRGLFATVLKHGLPIVAAHPAKARLKRAMMKGLDAVDSVALEGLRLEREYSADTLAAVHAHIQEVHCDQAPPSIVPNLVVGQRLKDAWMARALEQESVSEAAAQQVPRPAGFLIAGGGHTRPDRGVPMFLDRPDDAYTIAFVEVPRAGETVVPADFAGQADVLWFTPRVDDEDPCDKFAEELKKLGPVE
jgi:uncharacterized iron-regulated protein